MRIVRVLKLAFERRGLLGTLRALVLRAITLPWLMGAESPVIHPFDELYDVETSSHASLIDLEIDSKHVAFGSKYGPVTPGRFKAAIDSLRIQHNRFVFIDLGSGKGRALLLAAELPFKKIVGVEFSSQLHKIALRNINRFTGPKQCQDIRAVLTDAAEFEFPNEPLVIFLYNPFVGEVMVRVLQNLERSLRDCPREAFLLYVNPTMYRTFENSSYLKEIVAHPLHRVYESTLLESDQLPPRARAAPEDVT
jgi:SAM-dependent methyltransferase